VSNRCRFMNLRFILLVGGCLSFAASLQAQRRLTEATLVYKVFRVEVDSVNSPAEITEQALSTCYLKGANSRTDLVTSVGKQSTIFISKSPQVVLLKEYGNQRYLSRITRTQWEQSNAPYRNARIDLKPDTLRIKGYRCSKALVTLADSSSYAIWYTSELLPLNREFLPLASTVPGLILSFETLMSNNKVRYEIDQIIMAPVPQLLFDIPESGYRLLEQ
jgi:GLPGLI family protein